MASLTPEETVEALYQAINAGDLEAVVSFYEPGAVLQAAPEQTAQGSAALKEALHGFMRSKPTLTLESHKVVAAGDVALSLRKWRLQATDPQGSPIDMRGTSTDVLRKQTEGTWRIVIDNPWGPALLDSA